LEYRFRRGQLLSTSKGCRI